MLCRGWSGYVSVFVDEAVVLGRFRGLKAVLVRRWCLGGQWWWLVEGAVGSMGVVVVDVIGNESFGLVLVPDDCSIGEFGADGSDLPFRVVLPVESTVSSACGMASPARRAASRRPMGSWSPQMIGCRKGTKS
jgi:hypothetical protein